MSAELYTYILDEAHNPVPCDDIRAWGEWMANFANCMVARTQVRSPSIEYPTVSTVFLGINHAFRMGEPPVLFETMVFGGEHDGYQRRYRTWDEAMRGHQETVWLVYPGYELGLWDYQGYENADKKGSPEAPPE